MNQAAHWITQTADYLKTKFASESSGHDWWHIYRVWQTARHLAQQEPGADPQVVELAALLHDVADWKFHDGDDTAGPRVARDWLEQLQAPPTLVAHVTDIVGRVTYKGAGVETPMPTLEGKIVQDADRLDAIGAIGIARAFAYGGHKGREMHNPDNAPEPHADFEQYKKNSGPTINHFYEKLLLLRDRMQTPAGRAMAAERHAFMETFLTQFYREWEGR